MRGDAPPSPFGTSFVDLLVGALALVALLWVANAPHSGARGSGEASRSAAAVMLEQYGYAHLVKLEVSQPGRWSCTVPVAGDRRKFGSLRRIGAVTCKTDAGSSLPLRKRADGVDVDRGPHGVLTVRWRLDVPPDKSFREGLQLTVGGIAGRAVEAAFHIAPCCSNVEPHYVRLWTVSGAGQRTRYLLWHETQQLQGVLDKGPARVGWITAWRDRVHAGDVVPSLVAFDRTVAKCAAFQAVDPAPALRLRFDPEGTVRVETPPPGPGPRLAALHAEFAARLACYAGADPHLGRDDDLVCPGLPP